MLFIYGEELPNPIAPPAAAIIGSALLLMIVFVTKLDDVGNILHDIDWESLLFLICIFILVGALDKTGVIADLGQFLGMFFGSNVVLASLLLLAGIGVLSSVVPNVALVVAMLPLVKQYAVGAGLVAPGMFEAGYGHIPSTVLPLFFAMCFGATLGGNATLLGAGSNIIAAGICARREANQLPDFLALWYSSYCGAALRFRDLYLAPFSLNEVHSPMFFSLRSIAASSNPKQSSLSGLIENWELPRKCRSVLFEVPTRVRWHLELSAYPDICSFGSRNRRFMPSALISHNFALSRR